MNKDRETIEQEVLKNRENNIETEDFIDIRKSNRKFSKFNNKFKNLKVKYKKDPKKYIVIFTSILLLFSLVVGVSFSNAINIGKTSNKTVIEAGTLALELLKESNSIVLDEALPQTDYDAIEKNTEYEFNVKNTGTLNSTFKISLDNTCSVNKNVTVNGESAKVDKCIPNEYIKVALKEGNSKYEVLEYDEEKDEYIIDADKLEVGEERNYKMKIWLSKDTPNEYNAVNDEVIAYSGKLNIDYEQGEEEYPENIYVVRYDANGGTGTMSDEKVNRSESITLRENKFTKTGYTFQGYSLEKDGKATYEAGDTIKEMTNLSGGIVKFYAVWEPITYVVKYNANGGTGTMENSTHTYDKDSILSKNEFKKTGYILAGWSTSSTSSEVVYEDGEKIKNLSSTDGATINLYAVWENNVYTVVYNANGGTGTMANSTFEVGKEEVLSENTFTKEGYTFVGWAIEETGTVKYQDKEETKNITAAGGTRTLYAVWEANGDTAYKVEHYVMNTSGSYPTTATSTQNKTGVTDSSLTLSSLKLTTSAYNVANGIVYSHGTVGGTTVTTTTIEADGSRVIKLYYKRTYGTLTTVAGTNIKSVTTQSKVKYYYGATVPSISATLNSATGYTFTFSKWTSDKTSYIANKTTATISSFTWPAMPEGTAVTLTASAVKTANTYTVEYYSYDGGTKYGSSSHTYDTAKALTKISDLNTTAPSGKSFVGWATSANSTTTSKTDGQSVTNLSSTNGGVVKLYAIWKKDAVTYTATTQKNVTSATGTATSVSCTIPAVYNGTTQDTSCSVTLPDNPYTLTNWTFNGWVNAGSSTTTTTTSGTAADKTMTISGNVNIVATWKKTVAVTVTFDKNGGSANTTSAAVNTTLYNGSTSLDTSLTFTAPSATTRSGWTFVGYNTSASATTSAWAAGATKSIAVKGTVAIGNTTYSEASGYYHIWSKEVTATFYYYNGSAQASATDDCTMYNSATTCTVAVPSTVSGSSGPSSTTYKGVSASTGSTTTTTNFAISADTKYYAAYTKSVTATFYYYDDENSKIATATNSNTRTATTNGTTYSTSNPNITIPSAVSGSKGQYGNSYIGVATAVKSMTSATPTTANTTYYAFYRTNVTIYRPTSATAASSITTYRNSFFTSTSAFSTVLATTNTGTSAMTSVSGIYGTLKGFASAVNSTTAAYSSIEALQNSSATTVYAITTNSENATFYYNSNTTSGSITAATATSSVTSTYYCSSATAATVSHGTTTTVPTAVSESVGKYNSEYAGIANATSKMSKTTTFTGGSTYYAVYSSEVTIYRPTSATAASATTAYRNEYFTSTSAMTTKLATSATGTSDMSAVSGIYGTLAGFNTAVNTNSNTYASITALRDSNATTVYARSTNSITISYDANGGSGAPSSQTTTRTTYCSSTSAATTTGNTTISSTKPTLTGYTFSKWNTSEDGSGTSYNSGTAYNIGSTIKLYAQWTINSYTVTLNKGTGISEVTGAGTYDYGEEVTINATVATGYTWKEWTGTHSTTTKEYIFTMPASNVTDTANAEDSTKPTSSIATTSTLKSTTQTATLKCSDGVGVTGYYWGTSSSGGTYTTTAADLTSLTGSGLTKTVSDADTYYLFCKDAAGNVSAQASKTYYSYTVNNVLEKVDGTTGTYTSSHYASASNTTYIAPSGTSITLASVYAIPTGASSSTFKGYSTSFGTSAATLSTTAPSLSSSTTYYMWFNRTTYALTLNKGTGISAVTGAGTYKYGKQVSINATASTGYTFTSWTKNSGNSPASASTASTTVTITQATTLTANAEDTGAPAKPTITRTDLNTFSYTSSDNKSVTGYYVSAVNTSTAPTTSSSWVTTTSKDITAAGTYYVWARDAAGNISSAASITAYTISRSEGTGTTLTTRYDSTTSSGGTAFTSSTVMLAGTPVWASSVAKTGYNTATLKHGSTSMTASGASFTVSATEAITSAATINKYTVEYYTYDGSTKYNSSSHTYGTAKALTTASTLGATSPFTNNTFYGWATSANSTTRTYTDGQSVNNLTTTNNGVIKLYAIWHAAEKTLTATTQKNVSSATGNNTTATCKLAEVYNKNQATSCNITLPDNPYTLTSWTFNGWVNAGSSTTTTTQSGTAADKTMSISGNVNIVATWKKTVAVTLTFDKNGGSANRTSAAVNTTLYNGSTSLDTSLTFTAPSATTYSGWTFVGYNTSSSATTSSWNAGATKSIAVKGTVAIGNTTYSEASGYYHIWMKAAKEYTATTQKNVTSATGTGTSVKCTIPAVYNGTVQNTSCSVTLPDNPYTLTNWTFNGWVNAGSSTTTTTTSGTAADKTMSISGNVNIVATWKKTVAVTVTFDKNGGSANTTSAAVNTTLYNGNTSLDTSLTFTAPSATTYSGWTFVGYNTSASATSSGWNAGATKSLSISGTVAIGDTTFSKSSGYYHIWKKDLTATFYYYNGSAQATATDTCTMYNSATTCTVAVPAAVSGSGGPSSTTYKGVSTSTGSTTTTTSFTISANTKYYAAYTKSVTATFYYNSNTTSGSFTSATATASGTRTATTNGTTYSVNNPNLTVPTAVSGSKGQYGNSYIGVATAVKSMTSATPTTANTTYYAFYRTTVAEYTSYSTTSTTGLSTNRYRNSFFTSTTAMSTVFTESPTGTTNDVPTPSAGYLNTTWAGYATSSNTMTRVFANTADVAESTYTVVYSLYRTNVTIYRPTSTSAGGSITVYRNVYHAGSSGYAVALSTSATGTSIMTSVSGLYGTLKGFASEFNKLDVTYSSIKELQNSTAATAYAVSTNTITITFDQNAPKSCTNEQIPFSDGDSLTLGDLGITGSATTNSGTAVNASTTVTSIVTQGGTVTVKQGSYSVGIYWPDKYEYLAVSYCTESSVTNMPSNQTTTRTTFCTSASIAATLGDTTISSTKPTATGYVFLGWYTDTASKYDTASSYIEHPLYYYADTYSDLYSAFGYNEASLYNHYYTYTLNGSETRTIAPYEPSKTYTIGSSINIYAGWIAQKDITITMKYDTSTYDGPSSTYQSSTYQSLSKSSTTLAYGTSESITASPAYPDDRYTGSVSCTNGVTATLTEGSGTTSRTDTIKITNGANTTTASTCTITYTPKWQGIAYGTYSANSELDSSKYANLAYNWTVVSDNGDNVGLALNSTVDTVVNLSGFNNATQILNEKLLSVNTVMKNDADNGGLISQGNSYYDHNTGNTVNAPYYISSNSGISTGLDGAYWVSSSKFYNPATRYYYTTSTTSYVRGASNYRLTSSSTPPNFTVRNLATTRNSSVTASKGIISISGTNYSNSLGSITFKNASCTSYTTDYYHSTRVRSFVSNVDSATTSNFAYKYYSYSLADSVFTQIGSGSLSNTYYVIVRICGGDYHDKRVVYYKNSATAFYYANEGTGTGWSGTSFSTSNAVSYSYENSSGYAYRGDYAGYSTTTCANSCAADGDCENCTYSSTYSKYKRTYDQAGATTYCKLLTAYNDPTDVTVQLGFRPYIIVRER